MKQETLLYQLKRLGRNIDEFMLELLSSVLDKEDRFCKMVKRIAQSFLSVFISKKKNICPAKRRNRNGSVGNCAACLK